ncbi:MAG TPA: glycosyltransferase [Candidatus Paceibacterota bacterium]
MAKVIFIGSDRNIFKEGSVARSRMIEYGALFEELHIIIFNSGKKFKPAKIADNIFIYPTNSLNRWFYPFTGSRIIKNIIKKRGGEGWVVSAQDPFESGLAGYWASQKTYAKLHIQVHTDFLSPFFKWQSLVNILRLWIASVVLQKADGVRVVSQRIRSSLSTFNFQLKTNPEVLPIFAEKNNYTDVSPYDFKKDRPDWTFVILTVGRIEPEKNFSLAVRGLNIIRQKYPNAGLVIVGEGSLKDNLKRSVNLLDLSKNVLFIDGWQENLAPFYKGADIYIQTSNYEGLGLSAIEAAYSGLPVVTTDVGAAGWIFRDGENSKIYPVGDEKALALSVINLIEDNQIRERIIANLKNNFGQELIQSKTEYLKKYKESIESCFNRV